MTDKIKKRRKLSSEILIIVAICFALSLLLYFAVAFFVPRVVEEYCFSNNIVLDDYEYYQLDVLMFASGIVVAITFFIIMFFVLFGKKLSYIRVIIRGIVNLQNGDYGKQVVLVGNNELTRLAEAINYLSQSEQEIKEKEKKLREEKDEFIRTLSHDIRTPLTSIMSYTELLRTKEISDAQEYKEYLSLVGKKTAQIKELTDILLDTEHRNAEYFDNAGLLFLQLAQDFEYELEEEFCLSVELPEACAFSGNFDTGEMRRIFDNLLSNIKKYADPLFPVNLTVSMNNGSIVISQNNTVKKNKESSDSYKMGINSIRRIAQQYGGTVEVSENDSVFEIIITLSDF